VRQAESSGGQPYTQLDTEAHLPGILDAVLAYLLEVFPKAERGVVGFFIPNSDGVVLKAVRSRRPRDEGDAGLDDGLASRSRDQLESGFCELVQLGQDTDGSHTFSVLCAPMTVPSTTDSRCFGFVRLDRLGWDRDWQFTYSDLSQLMSLVWCGEGLI